jgi:hypothetical protein
VRQASRNLQVEDVTLSDVVGTLASFRMGSRGRFFGDVLPGEATVVSGPMRVGVTTA